MHAAANIVEEHTHTFKKCTPFATASKLMNDDDVQIHFTFDADSAKSNVFANCLTAVEKWLSFNKLKLKKSKTQ